MRSTRLMMARGGALLAVVLAESGCVRHDVEPPTAVDWPMYRGDLAGTGYSPLAQITTGNVADLTRAWSYSLRSDAPAAAPGPGQAGPREPNSQATPIVVGDVMYLPAVDRVVGRLRVATADRHHRPASGGQAEHRSAGTCGRDRHGWRRAVRGVDR